MLLLLVLLWASSLWVELHIDITEEKTNAALCSLIMSSTRSCFTLPCILPEVDIYLHLQEQDEMFSNSNSKLLKHPGIFSHHHTIYRVRKRQSVAFQIRVGVFQKKTPTRNTHTRPRFLYPTVFKLSIKNYSCDLIHQSLKYIPKDVIK